MNEIKDYLDKLPHEKLQAIGENFDSAASFGWLLARKASLRQVTTPRNKRKRARQKARAR